MSCDYSQKGRKLATVELDSLHANRFVSPLRKKAVMLKYTEQVPADENILERLWDDSDLQSSPLYDCATVSLTGAEQLDAVSTVVDFGELHHTSWVRLVGVQISVERSIRGVTFRTAQRFVLKFAVNFKHQEGMIISAC